MPLRPVYGPWIAWLQGQRKPLKGQRGQRRNGLVLERLEDRLAPATATFGVDSNWNTGFQAHITITNDGATPINNWSLEFNYGSTITSVWNGSVTAVNGHDTIQNAGYNSTIAPGASVTVGFLGTGSPTPGPTDFVINGAAPVVPLPTVSVADTSATQGGTGTTATFTVSLSSAPTQAVTVDYATADGTARAGVNYTPSSGTLTFLPGQQTAAVAVTVLGTPAYSPDASFTLTLSNPSQATLGVAVATATIHDSRPQPPKLPTVSVADTSATQGGTGTTATFTVSLSSAPTQAVTVDYATADGTARAGVNYASKSGTLTFLPGQLTATVAVTVLGTPAYTADAAFTLNLSNPAQATLGVAVATATIHDSRPQPQPLPQLSVSAATGVEGVAGSDPSPPPGGGTGPDFFHTSGNQIVDAYGNNVKITGVNWYGMEQGGSAPHGLNVRSYQSIMDQVKQLGFNTIRLQFSNQTLDAGSGVSGVSYALNPDLQGLNGLGIMDKVVAYAGKIGLRIILDDHDSSFAGHNPNGLWYTGAYSDARWVSDWKFLAARYANNPAVIGADLYNEPEGQANWGSGDPATDWRLAAERAGNAILSVNSNWLIFVEGVESGPSGYYWWGGNLSSAGQYPVRLNVGNRLVYSIHDYPSDVYDATWFHDPQFPNNLNDLWTRNWGYLVINNIAPVYVGEFGTTLQSSVDQQWLPALIKYMEGYMGPGGSNILLPGQQGVSWTFWSLNPESSDTGGLLEGDWSTPVTAKLNYLRPIQFAFPTSGSGSTGGGGTGGTTGSPGTPLTFTVTLSQASTTPVSVDYATADGTAKAGLDYTAASGTLTFAPGQTSRTVTVGVLTDAALTSSRTLSLVLSNPTNATITTASGSGTILPASAGTVTPPPAAPATASTEVTNVWGSVFNENVTITNTGTTPISNWTLEFDAPFLITLLWSGTIVSQQGNHYVVVPVWYDATINPGASITFGFTATGDFSGKLSNFKLNGVPI